MKSIVPAGVRRWVRLSLGWRWLHGDYATWDAARAVSAGYDVPEELERYVAAAREVEAGRALWDRDAVAFTVLASHEPLLAALRVAAKKHGGALDVVDFGGALGSTWRQHRAALKETGAVRWRVVEQPAWVEAGQKEFANDELSFHATLAEAAVAPGRQVLLLSGVLQYLEAPHALIPEAMALGFADVIVDRVPLWTKPRDRLTVQFTPMEYGGGSYPCWVFEREKLLRELAGGGALASEWEGFDDLAAWVRFRGFHFSRGARGG